MRLHRPCFLLPLLGILRVQALRHPENLPLDIQTHSEAAANAHPTLALVESADAAARTRIA